MLAEQEQRGPLGDEGARAPVALLGQLGQCRLRVLEHLLRAGLTQPGAHHADPGSNRRAPVRECAGEGAARRDVEPALGVLHTPPQRVDAAAVESHLRVALEQPRPLEPLEPAFEGRHSTRVVDGERDRGQDGRRPVRVPRRIGVLQSGFGVARRLEPVGCVTVKRRNELRLLLA